MEFTEVADPVLKSGEVLIRMKAIGLNYADIYRRKGNYHLKGNPPYIAGYEGAGVVVASQGNTDFKVGDRVAFADVPYANAELVAVPADHLLPLPEDVSSVTAAASLLQGLTAHYLVSDSYKAKEGDTVVVHAAAGGVGQFLTQMAKLKGANVIGLSRSERKLKTILTHGADEALSLQSDWVDGIKKLSGGQGADVVYDSVGSTLKDSFAATRDKGTVVFYGMSGGDPEPVDPRMLMDSSKTLTGGDLWSYLTSASERRRRSQELFSWLSTGKIKLPEIKKFPLAEGRAAHEFLESGQSAGKVLLIP